MNTRKELALDLLFDIAGSILIAVGIYNFALHANFPVAGFSGIAIILYHLLKIPVGLGTVLLNVPVSIFCCRHIGTKFFLKSVKTTLISSFFLDYIAPLFPCYQGDRLLAGICMGVLCGAGYALVFMRGSSTGGQDFITVYLKKKRPHLSLGSITFVLDILTIVLGTVLVFHDVDGLIYGIIVTYIMSTVLNRILYGIDQGKMTLIVTDHGEEMGRQIGLVAERGSTILPGVGSYSGQKKDVVMCACNNKEMYAIKKMAHAVDPNAFTIIVQSNEVVGEGFKDPA